MYILNYLYFFIISIVAFYFLMRNNELRPVSSPISKGKYTLFNGIEMFWVLTFSTGLLALSAPGILDLMAIRLLAIECFCILGLVISERKPVWTFVASLYAIYLGWLVIGLFYTPSFMYGIRSILKYIYPLLIMLIASVATRNKQIFFKAGLGARGVALFSIIIAFIPYIEGTLFPGVIWYGTARAINFISIMIFSLALFYFTNQKRKNLIYVIVFLLPCLIWVFRTSIMGSVVALMIFYFFKYKMKSLPIIAGIFILAIASVFLIPGLRDKMFKPGKEFEMSQFYEGEISMDDIQTNYRDFLWEWALDNNYKGHEVVGTGTGHLQQAFNTSPLFPRGGVVHNDFIQMLCDNGLIGLILYLLPALSLIIHCFIIYNRENSPTVLKICAITAGASMGGVLVTLYSDNVVNYSMATLAYPWGFYGMMLGLNRHFLLKGNS